MKVFSRKVEICVYIKYYIDVVDSNNPSELLKTAEKQRFGLNAKTPTFSSEGSAISNADYSLICFFFHFFKLFICRC